MKRNKIIIIGLFIGGLVGYFGASTIASINFLNNSLEKNDWQYNLNFGTVKPPSLVAAGNAKHGMFAHVAEEAVYFYHRNDASNGKSFLLHFDKEQLPPVDAFWSLTMYYDELPYNLVKNPINRYVISDRMEGVQFNSDGSLDIYIQHENPGTEKVSNWLPAPDGKFFAILRTYIPSEIILNETYAPPTIIEN